jgi:hypothetical protein
MNGFPWGQSESTIPLETNQGGIILSTLQEGSPSRGKNWDISSHPTGWCKCPLFINSVWHQCECTRSLGISNTELQSGKIFPAHSNLDMLLSLQMVNSYLVSEAMCSAHVIVPVCIKSRSPFPSHQWVPLTLTTLTLLFFWCSSILPYIFYLFVCLCNAGDRTLGKCSTTELQPPAPSAELLQDFALLGKLNV